MLVTTTQLGNLVAVSGSGAAMWTVRIAPSRFANLLAGAGRQLALSRRSGGRSTLAVKDVSTDAAPTDVGMIDGDIMFGVDAGALGFIGGINRTSSDERWARIETVAVDSCGRELWRMAPPWLVSAATPTGAVFAGRLSQGDDAPQLTVRVGRDQVPSDPVDVGAVVAVGTDDVSYAVRCLGEEVTPLAAVLTALRSDLSIAWALDLGAPCDQARGLLTRGGALFVTTWDQSLRRARISRVATQSPDAFVGRNPSRRQDGAWSGWPE